MPLGIYSVEADLWWWQNLPYRAFDLQVNAIPKGFVEASLGSRTCCNAAGANPRSSLPTHCLKKK